MKLQVGVKAFLKNKDDKYLILKRASSKFKGINGTWDLAGGRIETGNTLIENLKREIEEETGIDVVSEPKLLYAQDIVWRENDTHVVRLTYTAETQGQPILDTSENVEFKWLTIDELKKQDGLDVYLKEILDKGLLVS